MIYSYGIKKIKTAIRLFWALQKIFCIANIKKKKIKSQLLYIIIVKQAKHS